MNNFRNAADFVRPFVIQRNVGKTCLLCKNNIYVPHITSGTKTLVFEGIKSARQSLKYIIYRFLVRVQGSNHFLQYINM